MKKGKKISIIIAIAFIVVMFSMVVWQWGNIRAIYMGLTYSNEKIENKIDKSKRKLAEKLEKEGIVDEKIINGFSAEDEQKLKKGEITVEEAVEKIFGSDDITNYENVVQDNNIEDKDQPLKDDMPEGLPTTPESSKETTVPKDSTNPKDTTSPKDTTNTKDTTSPKDTTKPKESTAPKNPEVSPNPPEDSGAKHPENDSVSNDAEPTAKSLIEDAVKKMYTLKAHFVQQLAIIERNAKRVYVKGEMNMDSKLKIADMFMPQFVAAEKDCDGQVDEVLGNLKKGLEGIGADTSVIQYIREQYVNEKELQKSKYINEYL